jgi:hypothetical protein
VATDYASDSHCDLIFVGRVDHRPSEEVSKIWTDLVAWVEIVADREKQIYSCSAAHDQIPLVL